MPTPTAEHMQRITDATITMATISTELLKRHTDFVTMDLRNGNVGEGPSPLNLSVAHDGRGLAAVILIATVSGGLKNAEAEMAWVIKEAAARGWHLTGNIQSDRTGLRAGQYYVSFACSVWQPKKDHQPRKAA
jgi:hypothetical protein